MDVSYSYMLRKQHILYSIIYHLKQLTNTSLVNSNSFGNNESVSRRKDFKQVDKKKI